MSFKNTIKDVVIDTVKIGGCMGVLVVSGGILALRAYRKGYLDACSHTAKAEEKAVGE